MKNILRLIAFAIVMLMYGGLAWGQVYVMGSSRATDTNKVPAYISIFAKNVRLTQYASSDTNKVLGINAAGDIVLRTKSDAGTPYTGGYAINVAGNVIGADSTELVTVASFERDKNNNTQWYQSSYNIYQFVQKNAQFFNDTNIDGVKVVQLGNYIYALQGWNAIYTPKVRPYVFKWHVNDLATAPVRDDAPWMGRHGCLTVVSNGKIVIAGSDGQLLPTRQWDAWEATADDTGKLTWVQTNSHCDGCGELFMDGAVNPKDGYIYYGGGQDTVNYTYGVSDTLRRTRDNFRTSEIVGYYPQLGGNMIGTMQFFEDDILHIIAGEGLYHSTSGLRTYTKYHKTINVATGDTARLADYPGVPVQYINTAIFDGKIAIYGGVNSSNINTSGFFTYDANENYTTITNSTLPITHAAGFGAFVDTNGAKHLAKIAGNFTDDVWQVDITGVGFARQNQNADFDTLSANKISAPYSDFDQFRVDTIKGLHNNRVDIYSGSINHYGTSYFVNTLAGMIIPNPTTNGSLYQSFALDGSTIKPSAVNGKFQIGVTSVIATASSPTLYLENIGANMIKLSSNATRYVTLTKSGSGNNPNWEWGYVYASTLFSTDGSISGSGDRYWGYGIRVDSTSKLVVGSRNTAVDGAMWLKTTFSRGLGLYTSKAVTADVTLDNDTNLSIMCDIDNMVYMPDSLIIGAATGNSVNGSRLNVLGGAYFDGKVSLKTGSNKSFGTATLSGGTIVVNTTAVTANSKIYVTHQGCTNCGTPYISALSAGTSFTISSTNVLDGSTIAWWIVDAQ